MAVQEISTTRNINIRTMDVVRVVILLGLAAYFTFNIASGNLSNYVNERFAWLSYVAVAIFFALGLADLLGVMQRNRNDDAFRQFDHNRVSWSIIAVVAIPLLLGTLVPSQPLGADAVNGSMSLTVASVESATVTAAVKAPEDRNILDWLRVFSQTSTPADFNGTAANFIGFVYKEPDFPEDHFMVSRFTVSCCVADAGAIGIPVYAPGVDIAADEWVEVQGTFEAAVFRDTKMPILQVADIQTVEQPEHPYLYP